MIFLFKKNKAFSSFELFISIIILIALFLIVFSSLNPVRKLSETRNSQRMMDVDTIAKAVYQYSIDHDGNFPIGISEEEKEICHSDNFFCEEPYVNLSEITINGVYLYKIPVDPGIKNLETSGYTIKKEYGRIIVRAIKAELNQKIEVIK